MKAVVLTCFESNEERASFVMDSLKSEGYDVLGLSTNFSHMEKDYRKDYYGNFKLLETNRYNKNLSLKRMLSHKEFAKSAFNEIEKYNPNIVWICAPANTLIKEANKYKKKHQDKKIIIDIIDMWPESFPVGNIKKTLPFKLWRNIRRNNINCADKLICECDLYQDILSKEYKKEIATIHWARDKKALPYELNLPANKLSLIYIGSINNIIDVQKIVKIIDSIKYDVDFHIVGDGENKDNLINSLKDKCNVIYHGLVYDQKEKEKIFSVCHAGLNIYKKGLYIGLTVKSIDYFNYGLPIINNIVGDTYKIIEDNDIGFNVDDNINIDINKLKQMRLNNQKIMDVYNNNFYKEVFIEKCRNVIRQVSK